MGADSTQPRQGDSAARAAHRPGGEPERVPALPALLEPGEPQPAALPPAFPGCGEIPQCPVQVPERLLIRALGILRPPRQRRVSLLHRIPQPVQVHGRIPRPLGRIPLLAPRQAPVPGEPGRPRMRPQGTLLRRRRIQGEPVRLDDPHPTTPSPGPPPNQLMHPPCQEHLTFPAPRTQPTAPPRRRRRTLHTQASQTTPPPSQQPAADHPRTARPALLRPAARARQPRSMRARGPAAVTTRPAASPSPAAHPATHPRPPPRPARRPPRPPRGVTGAPRQSRSDRWPAEETRAYTAASPAETGTGTASTRISRPARLAGTGSPP